MSDVEVVVITSKNNATDDSDKLSFINSNCTVDAISTAGATSNYGESSLSCIQRVIYSETGVKVNLQADNNTSSHSQPFDSSSRSVGSQRRMMISRSQDAVSNINSDNRGCQRSLNRARSAQLAVSRPQLLVSKSQDDRTTIMLFSYNASRPLQPKSLQPQTSAIIWYQEDELEQYLASTDSKDSNNSKNSNSNKSISLASWYDLLWETELSSFHGSTSAATSNCSSLAYILAFRNLQFFGIQPKKEKSWHPLWKLPSPVLSISSSCSTETGMIIPDIITLLDSHGFDYRGPNFLKVYPRPAFEFLTHNVLANAVHFYLLPYNGVTIWLNNSTTTSMIRTPGKFNSNLELLTSTTADLSAISQRLKLLQLQFMGMTAVNFSSAAVDNVTLLLVKVRTVINSSSSSGGTGGGGSNSGSSPALSAVNLKSIRQTRNLTKTSWKILSTLADICQYGQESPVSPTTYPFAFVFTSGAISTSVPTSSHPPPPPLTPTHTHTHTPPPSPPPTQQNSLDSTIAGQQQIIDFRSDNQLVMQRLVNQTDS